MTNEEVEQLLLDIRSVTERARALPHYHTSIDEMDKDTWNNMTRREHVIWTDSWRVRGMVSFCCVVCGFPSAHGTAGCEACTPPLKGYKDDEPVPVSLGSGI